MSTVLLPRFRFPPSIKLIATLTFKDSQVRYYAAIPGAKSESFRLPAHCGHYRSQGRKRIKLLTLTLEDLQK